MLNKSSTVGVLGIELQKNCTEKKPIVGPYLTLASWTRNSQEFLCAEFATGIPGNFWNSGGNSGEFTEVLLFLNLCRWLWHFWFII